MTREMGFRVVKIMAAVTSGVLLYMAFPPQAQADSAWMALVPLMLIIRRCAPRAAAGWAALSAIIFWALTLSWFPAIIKNDGPWPLVFLGLAFLTLWCACFMMVYAYTSARLWQWAGLAPGWRRVVLVLLADPLLWVGTEWSRGWLLTGFAWNFLGVSQVANLPLIQVASMVGVYGVSAVLILFNGALTSLLQRVLRPFELRCCGSAVMASGPFTMVARLMHALESGLPLLLVALVWFWGLGRLEEWQRVSAEAPKWRVALIQPNAPCIFTLDEQTTLAQLTLLKTRTQQASAAAPDLMVWPETAVLGSIPYVPETWHFIQQGVKVAGAPLLTGALETEKATGAAADADGFVYYNAAWLFDIAGEAVGVYRKRHLVPFGEFIPLDKRISWLQRFAPTGVSCTPGSDAGILRVTRASGEVLRLGPLICFEDTVPSLSRATVRAGAQLLVLMTNDAWFNGSIEPVQHLDQSVFRAVENGVPLVRAANSGVSCAVDAVGRVTRLEADGKAVDFDGFFVTQVAVPHKPFRAPYTRWGDRLLALPGLLLVLVVACHGLYMSKKTSSLES